MKSKGFTLIELLAVIVILAIIALIATPIILNIIDDTKESSKERSKELYLDTVANTIAAYNMKNPMVDLSNAECEIITKDDEENNVTVGDLSCTETKDSKPIYIKVEMDGEKPTDGKIIFSNGKVTVTEELVFGNSFLAPTVTLSSLCGDPISYTTEGQLTLGDKYQCKVKDKIESPYEDGYYFYVLSYNNADGTVTKDSTNAVSVNLIMDQNINSDGTPAGMTGVTQATNQSQYNLVAWNSEDGQSINVYGPVTAMEFLHKATIGWTNIAPLNYIYNDRETQNSGDGVGYTSFVSTNGIATITPLSESDAPTIIGTKDAPLRSRMPIYSSDVTKTEVADHNANNGYLYDNLDLYGMNPPYAYLTLSSHADYSSDAWYVTYLGSVYNNNIYIDDGYGVRPVITVELD